MLHGHAVSVRTSVLQDSPKTRTNPKLVILTNGMVCSVSATAWSRAVKTIRTELLEIAYEEGGPQTGSLVLLLHGWPDAPRSWRSVAQHLHAKGWRTVAPYLRDTGLTKFL